MTVANRKTVSGFLHVSWRTAGAVARRVAERVKASMPSPFDGLTAIGVDETSHRKGHTYLTVVVDHERHRVIWMHQGHGQKVFDELVELFVYGTYLRLLLFLWVRLWVVVVGCRIRCIGA